MTEDYNRKTSNSLGHLADNKKHFYCNAQLGNLSNKPCTMLVQEFLEKVYMPYAEANKRHSEKDKYTCRVITAYFENKTFAQVSPLLIEKFKRNRKESLTIQGKRRAPASINRELEILSKIFTLAVDNNVIASNSYRKVKKLRQDNRRFRYLSQDEEERL